MKCLHKWEHGAITVWGQEIRVRACIKCPAIEAGKDYGWYDVRSGHGKFMWYNALVNQMNQAIQQQLVENW
jgi:hypothetical protein